MTSSGRTEPHKSLAETSREEIQAKYDAVIQELCDLGELWLEWHAERRDTKQVEIAIGQATRESRRLEKKLRKPK
jgi:hypothetical protein